MTIDVRKVREDEFDAWSDAIDVGFFTPKRRGEGQQRRRWFELDRSWGAFDEGKPVGSLRGITFELTVPGGAAVPLDGNQLGDRRALPPAPRPALPHDGRRTRRGQGAR